MKLTKKYLNKSIEEIVFPSIISDGFKYTTTNRLARETNDILEEIFISNFSPYNADVMKVTTFSFTITYHLKYKFIDLLPWEDIMRGNPHARRTLLKGINQPETNHNYIWYLEKDCSNIESSINDAKTQILKTYDIWFSQFRNYSTALDIFKYKQGSSTLNSVITEDLGGNIYSINRGNTVTILCIKLNKISDAIEYWEKIKESYLGKYNGELNKRIQSYINILKQK